MVVRGPVWDRLGDMKPITARVTGVFVGVVATMVLGAAVPAGAQTAPTKGLTDLLGSLLVGVRGPATAPASPPPPGPVAPAPSASAEPATPMAVEAHLAGLRYDVGAIDGVIDDTAASAVMAFQKVHGLPRTGQLSDQVAAQIMATSGVPAPLVPNMDASKVEIDLTRQVLFLYEGGSLTRILPVSSGTAATPTPTGSYKVYRKAVGWETSPLGRLYNSQYFVAGYAVHGSLSVPSYPASHGCVRIPMSAAEWFPDHVQIGTPVYVLGG